MRSVYPILTYPDARAAIDWLGAAFGATVHVVYDAPDGSVAHAELLLGTGLVMLGQRRHPRPRPADDEGSLYVAVDDVDAHCARARAAGAEIVREPADTDYGSREYTVRDL